MKFSPREHQVGDLFLQKMDLKQVAAHLKISHSAVKTALSGIKSKTGGVTDVMALRLYEKFRDVSKNKNLQK